MRALRAATDTWRYRTLCHGTNTTINRRAETVVAVAHATRTTSNTSRRHASYRSGSGTGNNAAVTRRCRAGGTTVGVALGSWRERWCECQVEVSLDEVVDELGGETADEAASEAAGGGSGDSGGRAVRNNFRQKTLRDLLILSTLRLLTEF